MNLTPDEMERSQDLTHATAEAQAEHVRTLIEELKWTSSNQRMLGRLWGKGSREIGLLGQRAEALIMGGITDPQVLRARLISQIHFVVQDAMQKKKPFVDKEGNVVLAPDADHRSALMGIGQIAKMTGVDKAPDSSIDLSKYNGRSLAELLEIANKKVLPEPSAIAELEVSTTGESVDEKEAKADKISVPNSDR